MPPELRLLEDGRAIEHDLEAPSAAGHERDVSRRVLLTNRGRQTGGPWFVVSDDAVFDFYSHVGREGESKRPARNRGRQENSQSP